jgi:F-type H+-transporting ATPase subunit b
MEVKKVLYLIIIFLSINNAIAATESLGHGHPSDLIFPAINFVIVFGFIFFKVKRPLELFFKNNAVVIKEKVESAEIKNTEAKIRLEDYENKLKNLKSLSQNINDDYSKSVDVFTTYMKKDTDLQVQRLKEETARKLEAEKQGLIRKIQEDLVEVVIEKTKTTISADASLKSKVKKNILDKLA